MKARPKKPDTMSRRRFVAMVAAGSAALLAAPAAGAPAHRGAKPKAAAAPAMPMSADVRREYLRQQKATLDTLQVIRKHAMPPGTELAAIFRPIKPARRGH
jgi:DMSO/TMAO reductase YedYZ molybdopterin-dependent catalytic subunit